MGKADRRKKDQEMAARLLHDPYHNPKAVKARKAARYRAFVRAFLAG